MINPTEQRRQGARSWRGLAFVPFLWLAAAWLLPQKDLSVRSILCYAFALAGTIAAIRQFRFSHTRIPSSQFDSVQDTWINAQLAAVAAMMVGKPGVVDLRSFTTYVCIIVLLGVQFKVLPRAESSDEAHDPTVR